MREFFTGVNNLRDEMRHYHARIQAPDTSDANTCLLTGTDAKPEESKD